MPDSLNISGAFAQELKLALDDALRLLNPHETADDFNPQHAVASVVRARVGLVEIMGETSIHPTATCDKIKLKRKTKSAIALLHEVLNELGEAA